MNYFAHGLRYLDRPLFLAGTATPDWLSIADRGVRVRRRTVQPFLDHHDPQVAEFAAGVLQHLHDDHWFHKTRGFYEVTGELAALFREQAGKDDRFRASFLGHIVTELLLDDVLREQYADQLDVYYEVLGEIDSPFVQDAVNLMARGRTERLGMLIGLFVRERFLYDYADPRRLLYRLNQVLGRVGLSLLPEATVRVLEQGREIVKDRRNDLLPTDHFNWPDYDSTLPP